MIKQAIIPLAGLGTRLLPLTSVFPKELLPINGKPGIEFILDECIEAGIKEVIIPKENEKDLVDMPKKIVDEIKITPVEYADQVLKIALTKELKRTEWAEVDLSKNDEKSQASIQ